MTESAFYRRSAVFIGAPTGFALEGLRDAERVYEKTTKGRARDARQELHNPERAAAPQRRAPVSAHQGTPGRDGGGGVGCQQQRSRCNRLMAPTDATISLLRLKLISPQ